ncbi:MAG TPA: hypothetical protein VFA67_02430 [Candidatus Sulfotelmatobacter sp.]|nr:hypothetical protein [Candidatus Sulfotelmatobacter sp.]
MTTKRSEKRQKTIAMAVRFTPEEAAILRAKAGEAGGVSAYIRHCALAAPLPPRTAERQTLNQILTEFQRHRGDLGKALSNLNQLTHYANMSRTLENSIFETIHEIERWIDTVESEIRLSLLQALGKERSRKPPKDE